MLNETHDYQEKDLAGVEAPDTQKMFALKFQSLDCPFGFLECFD